MNWTTVLLGVAMIVFGLVTTVLRLYHPGAFHKLEPMKQRWGPRAGFWIHVFGYSIVPMVAGAIIAWSGTRGVAVF